MTAAEVAGFARSVKKERWDMGVRLSHLTANLSLFDARFDGKKFPRTADELLGTVTVKPISKDGWRAMIGLILAKEPENLNG